MVVVHAVAAVPGVGTAGKIPGPPELGYQKLSEGGVGGSQPQLRKKHGDTGGGRIARSR